MLDPRLPHDLRRSGPRTLVAAALVFFVVAAALAYWGIDWLRSGCGCDESLYPDGAWLVVFALAGASFLIAVVLAFRAHKLIADPDR